MNAPIRVVLVDDEPLARERVRTLLAAEPDLTVVAECGNGRDAVEAIRDLAPDLVFLDVQMPELDGLGVLSEIGAECMPPTIFVTAFDEFALRAFDAHAVDYLLKPFDRDRFSRALERARDRVGRRRRGEAPAGDERLLAVIRELGPRPRYLERFVVRTGTRLLLVATDEVDWIEAEGNYARLHTGPKHHLVRETMAALEAKLDPERFVRIHRSAIVNAARIQSLEPLPGGEYRVTLRDGTRLASSRGHRHKLHEALGISD